MTLTNAEARHILNVEFQDWMIVTVTQTMRGCEQVRLERAGKAWVPPTALEFKNRCHEAMRELARISRGMDLQETLKATARWILEKLEEAD